MTDGFDFDEESIEVLETLYRTSSMATRRRRVREALALVPGERVLSVGTGPGFEPEELADVVGRSGRVYGVDAAGPMVATARRRCRDQPQTTVARADAATLPLADGVFDAATAVQIYEYVPDLEAAFSELFRVLRPGGRAVVFDSDWTTLSYHAADEARSERLLGAYDVHCPHPRLARTLEPRLERAGFTVTDRDVHVHFETELTDDAVGGALIPAIERVVTERGGVAESEAAAWVEDVRERARAGEYFFSLNQYLFLAEKPEA